MAPITEAALCHPLLVTDRDDFQLLFAGGSLEADTLSEFCIQ